MMGKNFYCKLKHKHAHNGAFSSKQLSSNVQAAKPSFRSVSVSISGLSCLCLRHSLSLVRYIRKVDKSGSIRRKYETQTDFLSLSLPDGASLHSIKSIQGIDFLINANQMSLDLSLMSAVARIWRYMQVVQMARIGNKNSLTIRGGNNLTVS